jgi:hypothetical protein
MHLKQVEVRLSKLGTGRTQAMCRNRYQRLNAPSRPNVICKNKCKRCGQLKRGHICTFVEGGPSAERALATMQSRRTAPPRPLVAVVPFDRGNHRPASKALAVPETAETAETAPSLLPGAEIPLVPPASDTAFQIDADLFRTVRVRNGEWSFERSRPLCAEDLHPSGRAEPAFCADADMLDEVMTQPDDEAYDELRACARGQEGGGASRAPAHGVSTADASSPAQVGVPAAAPALAHVPSTSFDIESFLCSPPHGVDENSDSLVVPFEAYSATQAEQESVRVPPLAPLPSFPSWSRAPSFSYFDGMPYTGMIL